jgi:hypothetical protein
MVIFSLCTVTRQDHLFKFKSEPKPHHHALSARGNDIYLLDTERSRIFRYDNFEQTLTPLATT